MALFNYKDNLSTAKKSQEMIVHCLLEFADSYYLCHFVFYSKLEHKLRWELLLYKGALTKKLIFYHLAKFCCVIARNQLISLFLGFCWLFTRINREDCFHSWWVCFFAVLFYIENSFSWPMHHFFLMVYFVWWYSVGLFSIGSDDVIVACVREVIDQLNQVSMSSKENSGINFNSHTARTALLNSFLFCHQHGTGIGTAVVQFLLVLRL